MPHKGFDDYDALPEAIRAQLTREQYAWLPDSAKAMLQEEMTMPDDDAEDQAS